MTRGQNSVLRKRELPLRAVPFGWEGLPPRERTPSVTAWMRLPPSGTFHITFLFAYYSPVTLTFALAQMPCPQILAWLPPSRPSGLGWNIVSKNFSDHPSQSQSRLSTSNCFPPAIFSLPIALISNWHCLIYFIYKWISLLAFCLPSPLECQVHEGGSFSSFCTPPPASRTGIRAAYESSESLGKVKFFSIVEHKGHGMSGMRCSWMGCWGPDRKWWPLFHETVQRDHVQIRGRISCKQNVFRGYRKGLWNSLAGECQSNKGPHSW